MSLSVPHRPDSRSGRPAHLLRHGHRPGEEAGLHAPPDWQVVEVDRFGPFYTRIVYQLPDGSQRIWTSRRHRLGLQLKRPARAVLDAGHRVSPLRAVWLPARLSWWMAVGYLVGCVLFLFPLALTLASRLSTHSSYWWYFAAALAFTAGNYCGLVSALNARDSIAEAPRGVRSYRWWGWRSDRVGYLISLALTAASLLFALRALAAATLAQRWPWVGIAATVATAVASLVFLLTTAVEVREARVRSLWWDPRNLAWCRAAISLLGCCGFIVGATASLTASVVPAVGTSASTLAFLVGTGLFLLGSYLILPELGQDS